MRRGLYRHVRLTGLRGPQLLNDQSTLHDTTIYISCLPGGSVTVDWGDGATSAVTCDGTLKTLEHTYSETGQYVVRILGAVKLITDFRCHSQAWISGDISSLSGLTSLVVLRLYSTSVSGDLSAVSGLTSLTHLYLYNTSVSGDISAVSGLTSLTHLRLSSTSVSGDISAVSGLTSLTHLYLSSTSISGDISAVSPLTSLVVLRLYSTSVSGDLSAVSGLTSLMHLYLFNTSVSGDLSAVSGLTSLTHLYLYNTSVSTYTSTPLPAWAGATLSFDGLGLSTGDLDDFLIDLADGVGAGVTVDCLTGNGPRSGASDAAVAAIVAAGGAVT